MDRTTALGYGTDAQGRRCFVDQNLAAGVDGTDASSAFFNPFVEEFVSGLIEYVGLVPNIADSTQVRAAISAIGGRTQSYTTPGTFTFTAPYTGYFPVAVVGAGGGGSNCASNGTSEVTGGSGGAGGWGPKLVFLTAGQQVPVVVGSCPGPQSGGGSSSFGTYISATGGQGSSFGSSVTSPRGLGGTCVGGDLNFQGNPGEDGQAGSLFHIGANGGAGPFGGAGAGAERGGLNGTAPGSGGGGAYDSQATSTNYAGGVGAPGGVFVRY